MRLTRSSAAPPDRPRSTSVYNPSWAFRPRARGAPSAVLCTTTMRPARLPARFAAVDSANRAGKRAGRIVVVQSTAEGAPRARGLNAQDGLYTLVERGLSGGAALERVSLIGAISRALTADDQWN